jgi:hypothetical protein
MQRSGKAVDPRDMLERPTMKNQNSIRWRSKPEKRDCPAAASYLSLTLGK